MVARTLRFLATQIPGPTRLGPSRIAPVPTHRGLRHPSTTPSWEDEAPWTRLRRGQRRSPSSLPRPPTRFAQTDGHTRFVHGLTASAASRWCQTGFNERTSYYQVRGHFWTDSGRRRLTSKQGRPNGGLLVPDLPLLIVAGQHPTRAGTVTRWQRRGQSRGWISWRARNGPPVARAGPHVGPNPSQESCSPGFGRLRAAVRNARPYARLYRLRAGPSKSVRVR